MWLIAGTLPDPNFELYPQAVQTASRVRDETLLLPGDLPVPVQRGTAALAATAVLTCEAYGFPPPGLLLAGDTGQGAGSRQIYAWLVAHMQELSPCGLTFHYLFPDLDWHNRVLLAVQALEQKPMVTADAGFMYVAKMSGYADAYDLFTPDAGELAFLADEKAPHPFYTRGFLLAEESNVSELLERARRHGNCPRHLLVKGKTDYIVCNGEIAATVSCPSVPAMECIGGTGDLVTGLATAFLAGGVPLCRAAEAAARAARLLACECAPTPSTQVGALIRRLPDVLRARKREILGPSA